MILRRYQQHIIDQLRDGFEQGAKRQVAALATGAGKTALAAEMIRAEVAAGGRSLFIVHRTELVEQTVRHLEAMNLSVAIMQGDNSRQVLDPEVTVATIQTLRSRGLPARAELIFFDECHVLHKHHLTVLAANPKARVIGLTATPLRKDLGHHFERLVAGPSIVELTGQGFLAPLRVFCPAGEDMDRLLASVRIQAGDYAQDELSQRLRGDRKIIGDIVGTWMARAGNRKTLVFAVDVAHAEALVEAFGAEGIAAATVTYRTHPELRRERIKAFRAGELQILISVDALSVGFDVPDVSCGIMARPTCSQIVYLQQAGRLLRPAEGKVDALLLDHAGNALRFGLPAEFTPPELGTEEVRVGKRDLKQHKVRVCRGCSAVLPPLVESCPECGIDVPGRRAKVQVIDGVLIEHGHAPPAPPKPAAEIGEERRWYLQLRYIGRARGHSPKAAAAQFREKFGDWPPWGWNDLEPLLPYEDVVRWHQSQMIRFAKRRSQTEGASA